MIHHLALCHLVGPLHLLHPAADVKQREALVHEYRSHNRPQPVYVHQFLRLCVFGDDHRRTAGHRLDDGLSGHAGNKVNV